MAGMELLVPEFEYREKKLMWYVYFGLISEILIIISGLTLNYSFIGLIFFIWAIIIMRQMRRPRLVPLRIDDAGISLGGKTWEYKKIRNFSIFETEGRKYLVFIAHGKFQVTIKIPITGAETIKERLNKHLQQVEYEEPFLESLSRRLNI